MSGLATLERKLETAPDVATRRVGIRGLALAGALTYGVGMLGAMLWSAWSARNWSVLLLVLPQSLLAVFAGAGAMAGPGLPGIQAQDGCARLDANDEPLRIGGR